MEASLKIFQYVMQSLYKFPHEESDLPDMLREMIGKHGFGIIWV